MLKVHIGNRQGVVVVDRKKLTQLVRLAAPPEWRDAEVSVALVESEQMIALNHRHTGRSGETDVLAFAFEDLALPSDKLVGEIVVSASKAVSEANARKVSPEDELALYLLHGVLHLAGFDDLTAAGRRKMYAREAELCREAGIPHVRSCAKRPLKAARKKEPAAGKGAKGS